MFTNLDDPDDDRAVLVRLAVDGDGAELVAEELFRHGATGIEERDGELLAGFGNRAAAREALDALAVLSGRERARALVEVPDDTWFDGWRAYARAHRAGRRLLVRPTWVPVDVVDDLVVVDIDPGRAFGSGAHPTTILVLAALEQAIAAGATSVLDVGSGSGVLSVAAGLLGAGRIVAVDIDAGALEATAANLGRNRVDAEVRADLPAGRFDVVAANIGARTLIELAPGLVALGARLLLAGFLSERTDEVLAAYPGSRGVRRTERDGWTCLDLSC
jgi:ribosomal protein L11 methyltransferase